MSTRVSFHAYTPISAFVQTRDQQNPDPVGRVPSETGDQLVPGQVSAETTVVHEETGTKSRDYGENGKESNPPTTPTGTDPPVDKGEKGEKGGRTRKPSRTPEPFDQSEREEMERLLQELRGHLGKHSLH